MNYWLLKSEPHVYAYADLVRDGQTIWDGVNNNLALKYIRTMELGDRAIIYHTGKERRAIGIAEITSTAYPDPCLNDPKRAVVNIKAIRPLAQAVTLTQIKEEIVFATSALISIGRLSIVPLTPEQWQKIMELSATQ